MYRLILSTLLCIFTSQARAHFGNVYSPDTSVTFKAGQRIQEQLGYANGYSITDIEYTQLISPYFEVSIQLKFLTHYGSFITNTFAAVNSIGNVSDNFEYRGHDRPQIKARQLVYGDFEHGRWFFLDMGLSIFNVVGYNSAFFRYWSGKVGLHEALVFDWGDPQFEVGLNVRSLTDFAQPENIGLIYPPTLDFTVGYQKKFFQRKLHLGFDTKIEQALASVLTAGSYDSSKVKPTGASTYVVGGIEAGYKITDVSEVCMRISDRLYRWPNNENAGLWNLFEEGFFGRAWTFFWRGQW